MNSQWLSGKLFPTKVRVSHEFWRNSMRLAPLRKVLWFLFLRKVVRTTSRTFELSILVGVLYKLLAKILANRLKKVIGKVE